MSVVPAFVCRQLGLSGRVFVQWPRKNGCLRGKFDISGQFPFSAERPPGRIQRGFCGDFTQIWFGSENTTSGKQWAPSCGWRLQIAPGEKCSAERHDPAEAALPGEVLLGFRCVERRKRSARVSMRVASRVGVQVLSCQAIRRGVLEKTREHMFGPRQRMSRHRK